MDLALLTLLFLTASVCFVFYFFSSSEVGGPQISFANPEICRPSASVAICSFALCGPNIFCDMQTQFFADLSPQILYFFPYKVYT